MNSRVSKAKLKNRKGEEGAALVTVLMISLILLVACSALILESSMNAANVTDALAEEQAYVAAESGIQSAINVLRGNVTPSPLLDTSVAATAPANLISFAKALKTSSSNLSTDDSGDPRLSRWLTYNATYNDRVTLGSNYTPKTGYAFDITLSDPDNTGSFVSYSTSGSVLGTVPAGLSISYNPKGSTTLNITGDTVNTDLGSFTILPTATSVIAADIPFQIVVTMSDPYDVVRIVRGTIQVPRDGSGNLISTTITPTSLGSLKIYYDSPMYVLSGSTISMTGGANVTNPTGYAVTPVLGLNANVVNCTMTATEPLRIMITSTGYGPRGAKKKLEAIVQKNFFNGMGAPATLTLIGSSTGFVFEPGNSQNVTYSGDDIASSVMIPPVGTDNNTNLAYVNTQFATTGRKADIYGTPSNVSVELPNWLWSPKNLDATVQNLRNVAKASGNYYSSGAGPSNPGDYATAKGITFIDGDYSIRADGGGILVVTGNLTLRGAFSFKGLIIVTGSGGLQRNGGGNGLIQGNVVIAPYNPANLNQPFLAPKYDISGGGNSTLQYDSNSVANGMTAVSNFVLGVAEK